MDDTTLGGYTAVHGRAAAFEGEDGFAYTAAADTDPTEDPAAPWAAYLVFVRWANGGTAIMGHLETPDLVRGNTEAEVRARLEATPLSEVKLTLDRTIRSRARAEP